MQTVSSINAASLAHARATAKNVVEAYRVLAHRGIALEQRAVGAGVAVTAKRLPAGTPLASGVERINGELTGFAGALIDGWADQANAVVDGVSEVASHVVLQNLGKVDGRMGDVLERVVMPVAMPVRFASERAEAATARVLEAVQPAKPRRAAKRAKAAPRRTARARR